MWRDAGAKLPLKSYSARARIDHPHQLNKPTSTRHNSTNMDPIQEAIREIESCELGEQFSYQQLAKKYGVNRCTLARRHKGIHEAHGLRRLSLHPHHETELVQYIDTLTERCLPPSREMIQRFASDLAGKEVSET